MDLKNPSTANDIAALAERLADRIEAVAPGKPDIPLNCEIAALLIAPPGSRVLTRGDTAIVVDPRGNPFFVPSPWASYHRGTLRGNFATSLSQAIALAEYVFDGWGWDIIKWPRGAGGLPASAEVVDGAPQALPDGFVYDAEVTPLPEHATAAIGHSLIGQHHTAGGAMLAAVLRGYAFKVKLTAGVLKAPELDLGVTDEERGWISDIVERAEEADLVNPTDRLALMMQLAAVHKQRPIDLEALLHVATDHEFAHDILGVVNKMDAETGALAGDFELIYAQEAPLVGADPSTPEGDKSATVTGTVVDGKFTVDTIEEEPKSGD